MYSVEDDFVEENLWLSSNVDVRSSNTDTGSVNDNFTINQQLQLEKLHR